MCVCVVDAVVIDGVVAGADVIVGGVVVADLADVVVGGVIVADVIVGGVVVADLADVVVGGVVAGVDCGWCGCS